MLLVQIESTYNNDGRLLNILNKFISSKPSATNDEYKGVADEGIKDLLTSSGVDFKPEMLRTKAISKIKL